MEINVLVVAVTALFSVLFVCLALLFANWLTQDVERFTKCFKISVIWIAIYLGIGFLSGIIGKFL